MPTLTLDLFDVHGKRLKGRTTVLLRNLRLDKVEIYRGLSASKRIRIDGLEGFPNGLYYVRVDPVSHLPVGCNVSLSSSGEERVRLQFPVDPAKVTNVDFAAFGDLPPDAVRLLEASGAVLGFEGSSGNALYDALDDVRRAGFLNIVAKCGAVPLPGGSVLSRVLELRELRGDRFFAVVPQALREDVRNSVLSGQFHPAPELLHRPPDGYTGAGSFKSDDRYGNLQLTFFAGPNDWVADIDIDDADGLEHVFQVVRNALTGRPTHPYDIHEILVLHQRLDPQYRLEV